LKSSPSARATSGYSIGALVAEGDPRAAEVLAALADGELQTAGKRVLIVRAGEALDAATGEKSRRCPRSARTSSRTTACAARSAARWRR